MAGRRAEIAAPTEAAIARAHNDLDAIMRRCDAGRVVRRRVVDHNHAGLGWHYRSTLHVPDN